MSRADFPLDLDLEGAIFNNKRLKNENAIPLAGSCELGLVFELSGGLSLFVWKLSPARKRGFFIAVKRGQKRK